MQDTLGREMLLENPSTYLQFVESDDSGNRIPVARSRAAPAAACCSTSTTSSCQAKNHGTSPEAYLDAFPLDRVKEIHLGGHDEQSDETGAPLLIDAHGSPVADPVWPLYRACHRRAPGRCRP